MSTDKNQKPAKAPGSLRKPLVKKKFEKRFLKYIEHPQDRNFFTGCFVKSDDTYTIRDNLTKDDVKKLNILLKSIKGNKRAPVRMIPIIFAGGLAAAIVIFFMIFANPLLGRAMELGLEAAFEGKSDVKGFRLSLIPLGINVKGITIANRNKPMTNLIDMGPTGITLKTDAVLRGKIYIESIKADKIEFGTPRKTSGALPARPPKEKKEKAPADDGPPMIDFKNFDAMALLNSEFDKLATPKLYDEAIAAYKEIQTKYKAQVDSTKAKAQELRTNAQPIINLNVSTLRDVDTIRKTVQDVNTMVASVQSAADDANKLVKGLEEDVNRARQMEANARSALEKDIAHLKSYADIGSGAAFAMVEPYLRDMLSDTAEEYLDYGLMALEALEKLKANAEEKPKTEPKPKKEKKVAFKGRDVHYKLKGAYPAFYLKEMRSDFDISPWQWEFALRDVSSHPDITNRPVSLDLGVKEEKASLQRQVSLKSSADFRSSPPESKRFGVLLSGSGFPVKVGDQLSRVGINGFTGSTALDINLSGYTSGGVSGGGSVNITNGQIVNPSGTIAEAIDEAVRQAKSIDLGIQYNHNPAGKDEFKITTNLADLINQAMRRMAQAYANKAMDEIEKALRKKIDEYIGDRFASKEEVDTLMKAARGDKDAMDQTKNILNNKKNEFENRVKTMATDAINEAADKAKQEAMNQAGQAAKDMMQGNTPSLQMPSTPSLPSNPFKR